VGKDKKEKKEKGNIRHGIDFYLIYFFIFGFPFSSLAKGENFDIPKKKKWGHGNPTKEEG